MTTLPIPDIQVGGHHYYSVHQLALALGVPAYQIINRVRDPESGLTGRKVGRVYLIDAVDFNEWIKTGKFEFRPRAKRINPQNYETEKARLRELDRRSLVRTSSREKVTA